MTPVSTVDVLVIGAGAAGSVVASRLTENPDLSVLLLEAGTAEVTDAVRTPWRWNEVLLTDLDWAYMSEPQPGMGGAQVYSAAGRGLGGTSNVYHMIHTRGRPSDYDGWAAQGATGWSYADVLPYLQRLEHQRDDTNPTAGRSGPIDVINARELGSPISQAFIDACVELGHPKVDDFNATDFGAGWHHVDIDPDTVQRAGAYAGYLAPALGRPNLTTEVGALVSELVFEGTRCVGARYLQGGRSYEVRARQEVVLSAGAIQSPKVLLLSGIGAPEQLGRHGIDVRVALPGVGENFHDHPLIIGPIGYLDRPGPDPRGQVTEVALFAGSEPGLAVPDLEICLVHRAPFGDKFFANVIKRVQTGQPVAPVAELVDPHVVLSLPGLVRPESRGSIRLRDTDPTAYPLVSANYYGERIDLERTTTMVEIARDIYRTEAFTSSWGITEVAPGPDVTTREALTDWVVANTGSYYHFAGSCRMGADGDPGAVVDPALKVRGTEGLRVVDASVMPTLVSANPHTTVLAIAERAAELIAADL
jgi:choline dehydrogenase